MANLKQWIEDEAGGEAVEAVVIGEMGWGEFGAECVPGYKEIPKGKVLAWAQAGPLLDYEFDSGFGAPGCNAVYVWTASKVMFVV